jgi:hypothetical protein
LNIEESDVEELCNSHYGGYKGQEKANAYLRYLQDGKSDYNIEFVLMQKELFDQLKDYDDYWEGKQKYVEQYYNYLTVDKLEKALKEQGLDDGSEFVSQMFDMFSQIINASGEYELVYDEEKGIAIAKKVVTVEYIFDDKK